MLRAEFHRVESTSITNRYIYSNNLHSFVCVFYHHLFDIIHLIFVCSFFRSLHCAVCVAHFYNTINYAIAEKLHRPLPLLIIRLRVSLRSLHFKLYDSHMFFFYVSNRIRSPFSYYATHYHCVRFD